MAANVLSRYLDPHVLTRVADRPIEPRDLVMGNLAGAHKSPLSGFAVEFAGHREYVPGDDTRHLDWRLYYKRERLFIKQYEMETNFVCHLLLDVSASMRYGEGDQQKLQCAAKLASTLAYSIIRQNDKAALATFDSKVRGHISPSNSLSQIIRMTQHLDEISPVEKTEMANCLIDLTGRMQRREIVFLISDFLTDLTPLESALQRMRYNLHEVVLFQVMHHHELHFNLDGMIKFKGLESIDEFLTQPEDIRKGYLAALARHQTALEELCHRNRVERVIVDTSRKLSDVLLDYLQKRNAMNARW